MATERFEQYSLDDAHEAVTIVAKKLIQEARTPLADADSALDRRTILMGELVFASTYAGVEDIKSFLVGLGANPEGAERLTRVLGNQAVTEHIEQLRFPGAENIPGVVQSRVGLDIIPGRFIQGILERAKG